MDFRLPFVFVTVLISPSILAAAPGELDTTFSADGLVVTSVGTGGDLASAVAVQTDGKIVAAGTVNFNSDVGLVRYNEDGSLDAGFGSGGTVVTDLGSTGENGNDLVVQEDGKLVVVGYLWPGAATDFLLIRYNSDGSLDTGFGAGGRATTDFGPGNDIARSVVLQNDGKIIVGGTASNGTDNDFALARFHADGTLDGGFGTGGKVTTSIQGDDTLAALALQPDGKILAAGRSLNATDSTFDISMVRFNAEGSLDTSFGTGGKVLNDFGSAFAFANDATIQPDGRIVVVGSVDPFGSQNSMVARYLSDGSLDLGFGTAGSTVTPVAAANQDSFAAVVLQDDGRIVAAGQANNGANEDFTVARFNADGSLDATFGAGGVRMFAIGGADDIGQAVRIQRDGKPLVAGYSSNGVDTDFALARLVGNTADLGVVKTGPSENPRVGDVFSYEVAVTNDGPDAAGGVTLTDTLPAEIDLTETEGTALVETTHGTCTGTRTITCDLGSLDAGETATVTYRVTGNSESESVVNAARITGQVLDPLSDNNSSSLTIRLLRALQGGGCSLIQ